MRLKILMIITICVSGWYLAAQDEQSGHRLDVQVASLFSNYSVNQHVNMAGGSKKTIGPWFFGGSLRLSFCPDPDVKIGYLLEGRYNYLGFRSDRYLPVNAVVNTPQSPIFKDSYFAHQVGLGAKVFFTPKGRWVSFRSGFSVYYTLQENVVRKTFEPGSNDVFFVIKFPQSSVAKNKATIVFENDLLFDGLVFLKKRLVPSIGFNYHLSDYVLGEDVNGGFADSGGKIGGKLIMFSLGLNYRLR